MLTHSANSFPQATAARCWLMCKSPSTLSRSQFDAVGTYQLGGRSGRGHSASAVEYRLHTFWSNMAVNATTGEFFAMTGTLPRGSALPGRYAPPARAVPHP